MLPREVFTVKEIFDGISGGLDALGKIGDLFHRDPERVAERQEKREIRQEARERRRARRRYRRWVRRGKISHYQQRGLVELLDQNLIRYTAPDYVAAPEEE